MENIINNQTQRIFKYDECVFERVYIETPVDTDGDGKYDLISAYIRRPLETLKNFKVPAVYVANPYLMTCNEDWYTPHNVDQDIVAFDKQNIDKSEIAFDFDKSLEFNITEPRKTNGYAETAMIDENIEFESISLLYKFLNERGYASVFSGGLGTRGSEGITKSGSREEVLAFKSVIDWLNGRARAFTNKTDNIEIKANWCTGNVAMSAKSYLGTMCIAVATTGVQGLKTIIPEAAISNWYDYYRCNGLNLPAIGWQGDDIDILAKYCFSRAKEHDDYEKVKSVYEKVIQKFITDEDRVSANYNKFWDERNYLNLIQKIKASVLIIHGINDWNVKTNQCIPFFKSLEKQGLPVKMILHQGDHTYIYKLKGIKMLDYIHKWLDHYLYNLENDIEKEPNVLVESNLNQESWLASDTWPPKHTQNVVFPIHSNKNASNSIVTFVDNLSKTIYKPEKDNSDEWLTQLVLSDEDECKNKIKYIGNIYKDEEIRISGTIEVSFEAALNRNTGILSAMLVDVGLEKRLTTNQTILDNGEFTFDIEKDPSQYKVISRGWMNAQNRLCNWEKEELIPNTFYKYFFKMLPTDYTIGKGHKIALILYGIDPQATQRPSVETIVKIKEKTINATVPVFVSK